MAIIESQHDWEYYMDGFPPSIGHFVEALDKERMAIGKAFGVNVESIVGWFKSAYGVEADCLSQATKNNPSYKGIVGQKTLAGRV